MIDACSYEYRTVERPGGFFNDYQPIYNNEYCKNLELTNEAKVQRRRLINEYRQKKASINSAIEHEKREAEEKKARKEKEVRRIANIKAKLVLSKEIEKENAQEL